MKTIGIGKQNFASLREQDCFYVDKTDFIREWWESKDDITLITRPRRFGKTLNISMLECFFSNKFVGRGDLFQGLSIWKEEKYRLLQGTYPVVFLTFADIKTNTCAGILRQIKNKITTLYNQHNFRKESIFSDLNNLEVVTTTTESYVTTFGFTEKEVFAALDEAGMTREKEDVKFWYDGFTFGNHTDIYNPWSITNFLKKKKYSAYWADTSSNNLVNQLIRQGDIGVKQAMEDLLDGKALCTELDEQIVYNRLEGSVKALWSMLLASGYLKVAGYKQNPRTRQEIYDLKLTNFEVELMFEKMFAGWFEGQNARYQDFVKALLKGNLKEMNYYMNKVALDDGAFA